MANKICYIVGSGVFDGRNFAPRTADFIIAADGGYRYLERMDIMPDLIMGDFDSLGKIPNHPNVITHPTEKDDTDLMLAVKYAMEHGFKIFCIFGCMGGRTDMSIATMQTLCYILNNGCTGLCFRRKQRGHRGTQRSDVFRNRPKRHHFGFLPTAERPRG